MVLDHEVVADGGGVADPAGFQHPQQQLQLSIAVAAVGPLDRVGQQPVAEPVPGGAGEQLAAETAIGLHRRQDQAGMAVQQVLHPGTALGQRLRQLPQAGEGERLIPNIEAAVLLEPALLAAPAHQPLEALPGHRRQGRIAQQGSAAGQAEADQGLVVGEAAALAVLRQPVEPPGQPRQQLTRQLQRAQALGLEDREQGEGRGAGGLLMEIVVDAAVAVLALEREGGPGLDQAAQLLAGRRTQLGKRRCSRARASGYRHSWDIPEGKSLILYCHQERSKQP